MDMEERIAEAVVSRIFSRAMAAVEAIAAVAAAYFAGEWAASFMERPLPLGILGVALLLGGFLAGWLLRAATQCRRSPMWLKISSLSGVSLEVVREAYPDGLALGERDDVRWGAISRLVESGVLSTSEAGVVTASTRYALTDEAMAAIKGNEKRFGKL